MTAVLDVSGVSKNYGSLAAVQDVSFTVREGEIVGLIGPNGAGKTTLIGILSGAIRATKGAVAARPKLLLLDEVMAGLIGSELGDVLAILRRLPAQGVSIVVIEHVMQAVRGVCER